MNKLDAIKEEVKQMFVDEFDYLEPLRKQVKKDILTYILVRFAPIIIIAAIALYYSLKTIYSLYISSHDSDYLYIITGITIAACFIVYFRWIAIKRKGFEKHVNKSEYVYGYKSVMLRQIIPLLDPNMAYDFDNGMPENDFVNSFPLFKFLTEFNSEDSIVKTEDESSFSFSEISAKQIVQGKESDLFRGLFLVAEFPRENFSSTYVLPDKMKYLTRFIFGKKKRKKKKKFNRIKLEDSQFEKHFEVFGTNQIESRTILTPSLMAKMVDIKRKTKLKMQFSFIDSKMYFAMFYPINMELFTPPILTSSSNLKPLNSYLNKLLLITNLVTEINNKKK